MAPPRTHVRTMRGNGRLDASTLTVGVLFDSYETHVTPTKGISARKHDHRALEMVREYFGAHRAVASLDRRDWDGFIRDRRAGRIRPAGVKEAQAVRNWVVEQDLRLLLAVPHLILVWLLGVAWLVTSIVAWFAIVLNGEYPKGLYEFAVGVLRWSSNVEAYLLLLHDEYPPFTLHP